MKYIKRIFENTEFENEPAFGEGRIEFLNGARLDYLPAEQLKKSIDEFEDLLMLVYPFIDKGLSVRFDSAYGQRVFMTYEDYQSKNNKWIEFINAYPRMNHIEVVITFDKFDFRLLSEVLNSEFDDFLQKITLYKWKNEHTDISMNPDSLSYKTPMKINIELKKIRE
jgi:hypothetical protein